MSFARWSSEHGKKVLGQITAVGDQDRRKHFKSRSNQLFGEEYLGRRDVDDATGD